MKRWAAILLAVTALRADESARVYKGELDPIGPFQWPDMNGRVWTEKDFAGKIVVAQQWAAWCRPCVEEMPEVQRLYDQLKTKDSIVFVSVDMDRDPEAIQGFLKEFRSRYSFPVLFAGRDLKIRSIPRVWVIDKDGYIRDSFNTGSISLIKDVMASIASVKYKPPVSSLPPEVRDEVRKRNEEEGAKSR